MDITVTVCLYASVFVCMVTDFSSDDKASGIKFCTFIGVQGKESPILGNFAAPAAQNWTNRAARKQRMFMVLVEYVRVTFCL